MAEREHQETIDQLVQVIQTDMPSSVEGMTQEQFDQLCRNIARAIATGLQMHEDGYHRIAPEFGEPDRP